MPCAGSSCDDRIYRVPKPSSFLSVAAIRASEMESTICLTVGFKRVSGCCENNGTAETAARQTIQGNRFIENDCTVWPSDASWRIATYRGTLASLRYLFTAALAILA